MFLASPAIVGIFGAVIALVLIALVIIKRYRIAKPDEAIIVTGGKGKEVVDAAGNRGRDLSGQKVVTGGGVFVVPFVQKSFTISLRSRRLSITTEAQTTDGITMQAQAVAVVKVGGTQEMIRAAAQRFLSNSDEIDESTQEVLSGSLRSIIGGLTVLQIIRDRAVVAQSVLEAAEEALTKQGLVVDTLQIQEIRDGADYIANIGRPEAAKVRQAADIAETNAYQASQEAKIAAEQVLVDRNRELKLRQAAVQVETDKATAQASAAQPLEQAIQQQAIVEQQQITAQKEVALKTEQLNADVRAVAEAEAYRVEALAKAEAAASVSAAEGRAKAVEREGVASRVARIAAAEALEAEGRAEAAALEAKGTAEATAIDARARALETQSQAVLAQELIHLLPEIATEYARAIGAIEHMTVVSADGTSKVAGEAMGNIKGLLEMAKDTVGIDLAGMLNGAVSGGAAGAAAGRASRDVSEGRRAERRADDREESASRRERTAGDHGAGYGDSGSADRFDSAAESDREALSESARRAASSAATAASAAADAADGAANAAGDAAQSAEDAAERAAAALADRARGFAAGSQ
ncbi:SPFH domain-containing protein [Leucobacter chromiiresistens]|uniref:Flotillin n=2 Tax=Leucobacter chromiiresistens TaxID=1079994 RepID=A0A1H0YTS3_9MICO|nr:flotillin family protein [Leucobacter chromiiresistens]SDQ18573.1 flotillin [Leucobacter chromiiresistens]